MAPASPASGILRSDPGLARRARSPALRCVSLQRGLALATSAAKAPTTATFRQQPDEILQFWRTWARSNVRVP